MIYCIIGTRAQLIKMAPVVAAIEKNGWAFRFIHTGQHIVSMDDLRQDFGLTTPWEYLVKKEEAKTVFGSLGWLLKTLFLTIFKAKKVIPNAIKDKDIVLVHGDTFSTVIGALLGKFSGASVAHIESGLRSFNILNPFPEELNRLATFSLSDIAFCPGYWAVANLKSYKKIHVINTHQNTLVDSLKIALQHVSFENHPQVHEKYAVVSIHRFENIFNKRRLYFIINAVQNASAEFKIIFVMHPVTENRLKKMGLLEELSSNENVELRPRVGYIKFVELLAQSSFVITDGGSNQEELAYLGKPALLMRKTSERPEGLGENVVLSNYSLEITKKFLSEIERISRNPSMRDLDAQSPTKIIMGYLEQYAS